jgi:excisionase family DNA binding protein
MARTTSKSAKSESNGMVQDREVFTLSEMAEYLRISENEVIRLVNEESLPGRQIGADWRFLKQAVQSWLSTPKSQSKKQAFLEIGGKFRDDPFLQEIVEEIYRQRGRALTDEKK